jgi:hypothetical protein
MTNPNVPSRDLYRNFQVAIYSTVYDVQKMEDLSWLQENFDLIQRYVKVNKVYLETHRDMVVADETTYRKAQQFLRERGVQVSGGITVTVNERNRFQTYCYTNPEHRQKLKEIVAYTARMNNELILDDFFFTNCKCPSCIQAKGERSWTDFRLELMVEAAQELVLAPARAANPRVKVTIKYPNWYEHFQGLGFNLHVQPQLFDKIYTGNETRDPVFGTQHFQEYHGYSIFRYFENIKPGGNAGGWVDPFGSFTLDRYAEQFWVTLFAKAPEVTMFNFSTILMRIKETDRGAWQGQGTSFDFDKAVAPAREPDGALSPRAVVALAAGSAFEQVDAFLDKLGKPQGVACYRPYHSTGEDFLHSYLGMVGIPIDLQPAFPTGAQTVLLTESARADPQIVSKIQRQLLDGKNVVITSGLLRALQGRGTPGQRLSDIVELEYTDRKATVDQFLMNWRQVFSSSRPVTVPQINYLTNDSWEEIHCLAGVTGCPLLHSAEYGRGVLYVLTIPDYFGDLYCLPAEVLDRIREVATRDLYVRVDGPAKVALYVYDNDIFIVESFLPDPADVRVVIDDRFAAIQDVLTGETFSGEELFDWRKRSIGKKGYPLAIKPHSFRVLRGIGK